MRSGVIPPVASWVHVTEDVEGDWAQMKPNVDAAARLLQQMGPGHRQLLLAVQDPGTPAIFSAQSGFFPHPDARTECIAEGKAGGSFGLVPLIGGCSPALGWKSLKLFVEKVKPAAGQQRAARSSS